MLVKLTPGHVNMKTYYKEEVYYLLQEQPISPWAYFDYHMDKKIESKIFSTLFLLLQNISKWYECDF